MLKSQFTEGIVREDKNCIFAVRFLYRVNKIDDVIKIDSVGFRCNCPHACLMKNAERLSFSIAGKECCILGSRDAFHKELADVILYIEDQLCGMYLDGSTLCVVGNLSIYKLQADTLSKEQTYSHDTTVSGYVDWAYVCGGHYYVMFRYDQRVKDGNIYEYGILLKVDLDIFEKTETPIRYDKRTTLDDMIIFPAEMFEE